MKKLVLTGNLTGDLLLAGFFVLAIGVGILTTTLLWKFDLGNADLVTKEVPVTVDTPTSIVMLGDSLTQGVGATSSDKTLAARVYKKSKPGQQLWNFGLAGAKIAQVQGDQLQRLAAVKPSGIYLVVGANDVTGKTDPAAFEKSYAAVIHELAKYDVPVVVLNIPKLSATPAVPQALKADAEARTIALNKAIAKIVATKASMRLVDVYAFSEKDLKQDSGLLSEDNFHPNDAGYEKMAEYVQGIN